MPNVSCERVSIDSPVDVSFCSPPGLEYIIEQISEEEMDCSRMVEQLEINNLAERLRHFPDRKIYEFLMEAHLISVLSEIATQGSVNISFPKMRGTTVNYKFAEGILANETEVKTNKSSFTEYDFLCVVENIPVAFEVKSGQIDVDLEEKKLKNKYLPLREYFNKDPAYVLVLCGSNKARYESAIKSSGFLATGASIAYFPFSRESFRAPIRKHVLPFLPSKKHNGKR